MVEVKDELLLKNLLEARTTAIKYVQKKAEDDREIAKIYALEFAEKPDDKDARKRATDAVMKANTAKHMCNEAIKGIDILFHAAKELLNAKA